MSVRMPGFPRLKIDEVDSGFFDELGEEVESDVEQMKILNEKFFKEGVDSVKRDVKSIFL
jgi:hypothetical protein